jgi:hypothetical protein
MSQGPTPEQLNELWQALLHVQRLALDPQLPEHPQVLDDALAAAYELDETYAVVGIVSYAGGRFAALQELAWTSPFGEATITLPRQVLLDARPAGVSAPLFDECLDLVEAEVNGDDINASVAKLASSGGLEAFKQLALICAVLGTMVVERDPSLRSMDELLARETAG